MSQLIHVFECRSENKSLFGMNPFGNMKLVFAVIISVGVLSASVFIPELREIFGTVMLERQQFLTALGFSIAVPLVSNIFSR